MRRSFRVGPLKRLAKLIICIIILWTALDLIYFLASSHRHRSTGGQVPALGKEKIFIASIHWTDESILRSHWAAAVLQLAQAIGPENVFISIYESGSLDDSKGALRALSVDLEDAGIPHKILLDETTRMDVVEQAPAEVGWLQMPRSKTVPIKGGMLTVEKGKWVPRRIPYLSRLRNLALQPMREMQAEGRRFDKVLFLNDVAFDTKDIEMLLATRGGEYAAACSFDFQRAPLLYDTFALRDSEGHEPLMLRWPYFRSRKSRDALKRHNPVPVASCWNGIVVMPAAPFYDPLRPLSFRGTPDGLARNHLEGSESCLIHADNPSSRGKGVFMNPDVRVGYNSSAYETVRHVDGVSWPSSAAMVLGMWENRIRRWFTTEWMADLRIRRLLQDWRSRDGENREVGEFCLINEMQVLIQNGWIHA